MMKAKIVTALIMAMTCLLPACAGDDAPAQRQAHQVRPPAVAGAFYPGQPATLRKEITRMLDAVPAAPLDGTILAAMAPHAGYVFSGQVAAHTFRALANTSFDTLVIIGHDSHRDIVAHLCGQDEFKTPLGRAQVDRAMVKALAAFHPGIRVDNAMHQREHTVEVQLPFLQVMGQNCKIVPILFGDPTPANCRILADAIAAAAGEKTVFILASCDMSHYPSYEQANMLDPSTLKVIESLDVDKLFAHLAKAERQPIRGLQTAMCAKGGVGTAMLFAKARGADRAQTLKYANSGDAPAGDKARVVGYGAAVMLKSGE